MSTNSHPMMSSYDEATFDFASSPRGAWVNDWYPTWEARPESGAAPVSEDSLGDDPSVRKTPIEA